MLCGLYITCKSLTAPICVQLAHPPWNLLLHDALERVVQREQALSAAAEAEERDILLMHQQKKKLQELRKTVLEGAVDPIDAADELFDILDPTGSCPPLMPLAAASPMVPAVAAP